MNRYCRDAKNYLKKVNEIEFSELANFIDDFNCELENYSLNGLSSYLLCSIEVCLKLANSIGYKKGEVLTRWLKGYVLFLGGQYDLSIKSYNQAISMIHVDDEEYTTVCYSYALNLFYIGEFAKSLELIVPVIKTGDFQRVNHILSHILKSRGEKLLSYSVLEGEEIQDHLTRFHNINSLIDLNRIDEAEFLLNELDNTVLIHSDFFTGYKLSISFRISAKRGEELDLDLLRTIPELLKSKNSFYHYIDGLLNVSEVLMFLDEHILAQKLLVEIKDDKGLLTALDCRLYKLLEKNCLGCNDFEGAYKYVYLFSETIKNRTTFDIDRSLRDLTSFMY